MSEPQHSRGGAHSWIRSNILGLVAIFIALSGSALATQTATKHAATSAKKKRGPRGPAGPPGAAGLQGAQGVAGVLTGPAGGDLTGNYPTPEIAPQAVGPAETGIVPAAKAVSTSATSVPSGTPTTIAFGGTFFDYANMHSNVTNNERLTAAIDGVYLAEATIGWPAADGGGVLREISIAGTTGSTDVRYALPTDSTINNVSVIVPLLQGDELHVVATQTSGSALGAGGQFSMIWLGPLAPA